MTKLRKTSTICRLQQLQLRSTIGACDVLSAVDARRNFEAGGVVGTSLVLCSYVELRSWSELKAGISQPKEGERGAWWHSESGGMLCALLAGNASLNTIFWIDVGNKLGLTTIFICGYFYEDATLLNAMPSLSRPQKKVCKFYIHIA